MPALRYFPPNMITLLSLTLGLISIHHSMRGNPIEAGWFILYSVLLDKLDGTLARLLGAQSRLGTELDSFADFIAFGLAPAFLLIGLRTPGSELAPLGPEMLPALLYIFGCVLRLARYNVLDSDALPGLFRGVPSTLSGGLIASGALTALAHGVSPSACQPLLGFTLGVLGILMVSPLYLPKIGTARAKFWKGMTVVNLVAAYVFVILRMFPDYLFALAVSYTVAGSFVGLSRAAELRTAQEQSA